MRFKIKCFILGALLLVTGCIVGSELNFSATASSGAIIALDEYNATPSPSPTPVPTPAPASSPEPSAEPGRVIQEALAEEEGASPENSTISISFAGDCTLGYDPAYGYSGSFMELWDKHKDYEYFFKNVKEVFGGDDLTVVNLEGPLTNSTKKADKQFSFSGKPEFTRILAEGGVEAVNLANNHTYDYGAAGFKDTQNALDKEGIGYYGEGTCYIKEINGVKTGFLGYKSWTAAKSLKDQIAKDIQDARNNGADLVIATFHWGDEGTGQINSVQKELGRHAVDSGADLVVGHHPHVLQGIEEYKGKYIAYSVGNFCFGGNKNPRDKDTMIFMAHFQRKEDESFDYGFTIYPCSISSVSFRNDFSPVRLYGKDAERVAGRLESLSKGLMDGKALRASVVVE